jgi:hypothetical protein
MRPREFHLGDLVLRRVQANKDRHKLSPPWEGPFIMHEVLRPGTYVGDSLRGPLKRRGNPHLKPATKPRHAKPNRAGA